MVRIGRGPSTGRQNINHVVMEILAPWGPAIEERPKVLSEVERLKIIADKREKKIERRRKRREGEIGPAETTEIEETDEAEESQDRSKEQLPRTS